MEFLFPIHYARFRKELPSPSCMSHNKNPYNTKESSAIMVREIQNLQLY